MVVDGVPGVGAVAPLDRPDLAGVGDSEAGRGDVRAGRRRPDRLRGADVVEGQLVAPVDREWCFQDEVLTPAREADGSPSRAILPTVSPGPRSSWKRGAWRVARKVMTALPVSCSASGPRSGRGRRAGRRRAGRPRGVDAVLDRGGQGEVEVLLDRLGDRRGGLGAIEVSSEPPGAALDGEGVTSSSGSSVPDEQPGGARRT